MSCFFAVYDPATGAIKRYGMCPTRDLASQAQAGEAVIELQAPAPDGNFAVDITKSPPVVMAKSAARAS